LDGASYVLSIPLLDRELDETAKVKNTDNKLEGKKVTSSGRSITSFQMVHTHASLPRGWFFGNCEVGSGALIWALKQDTAIDAKSKYREEICS
jgi:hypothetical protein